MLKLNPLNERIKCDYARHLKAAQATAPPPSTPRAAELREQAADLRFTDPERSAACTEAAEKMETALRAVRTLH